MFASRLALCLLIIFSNTLIANHFLWIILDNTNNPKTIACTITTNNFQILGEIYNTSITDTKQILNNLVHYKAKKWILAEAIWKQLVLH